MGIPIYEGENTLHAPDRAAWRDWLAAHHASRKGVWLIIYHKKSGIPTVYYPDAVDEAICFGWIDSTRRKRDHQSFYQYFAVRNPKSSWSRVNKEKVERLLAANLMMPPGLQMVALAKDTGTWDAQNGVEALHMPPDLQATLARHPMATTHFEAFPKSVKRFALDWIGSAKHPYTRLSRVEEVAELANQNIRPMAFVFNETEREIMANRKKTAVQKRDQHRPPFVQTLETALGPAYPAGRMLISQPLDLQAIICEVPLGKVLSLGSLRARLARDLDADYTCPMTTGIFLRILAEAADEESRTDVPWWRVVRDNGQLIDKLPGGTERQATLLEAEQVSLLRKGKTPKVAPLNAFVHEA
jgi:uncharacterized protein YdeI (YjbR/CyaY-like superfamily)/alkylated DNA nucleotide flippase Atl1